MIKLNNVRIAFLKLAEAKLCLDATGQVRKNKKGVDLWKRSVTLLIPKTDPQMKNFISAGIASCEKAKGGAAARYYELLQGNAKGYTDGDTLYSKTTLLPYEGFPGNFSIIASVHNGRPIFVKSDLSVVDKSASEAEYVKAISVLYEGCYVNAVVTPYFSDNYGKVSVCLDAIQFNADGDVFVSGAAADPSSVAALFDKTDAVQDFQLDDLFNTAG